MHVFLCSGKPDEEQAELYGEKETSASALGQGADADGCCCPCLCTGNLLISRGILIWQDKKPERQLLLTILALGSQADLLHGHLAFKRMFHPPKLNCRSFHLQSRYIKQMTLCNRLLCSQALMDSTCHNY